MDFGKRAYDHSFHYDPIIRSLMDTDFYKILMLQVIWENYSQAEVTFSLINRTKRIKLGDVINFDELQWQFEYTKDLSFTDKELIWLQGQTFYGQKGIFKPKFIEYLRTFRLSNYKLTVDDVSGQVYADFYGKWGNSMLWEIFAIAIVNTMRYRSMMRDMKRWELHVTYTKAETKLIRKLEKLQKADGIKLADFATRRRHDFLWQRNAVELARDMLGDKFTGTSNAFLAMELGLEAKGTNAHEMPMAFAAMTTAMWGDSPDYEDRIRDAQYEVLRVWEKAYDGALRVFLPDTFGTTQFLRYAPKFVENWTGARPDSKDPIDAGNELIDWWKGRGQDPTKKLIVFSDSLDVTLDNNCNGHDMIDIYNYFKGKVGVTFGWGTNFGNDFLGCVPRNPNSFEPVSLVCKVSKANGRPAVKLSDNYDKATGPKEEVELYRQFFGSDGMKNAPITV